jgi:hypothetical protein
VIVSGVGVGAGAVVARAPRAGRVVLELVFWAAAVTASDNKNESIKNSLLNISKSSLQSGM